MKRTITFFLVIITAIFLLSAGTPGYYPLQAGISDAHAADKSAKSVKKIKRKSSFRKKGSFRKRQGLSPTRRALSQRDYQARYAALVVDADTGQVLYEVNPNETRHPASLTKMMTLYLLFEALKNNQINMDTHMPVSDKAASAAPTNIDLTAGDRITVKTAIESLIIRSANDSAMVVAEALGGSQWGFSEMMNRKAKQLGMTGSNFENPSGLPDVAQITTAYDLAKLGIALRRDFPEYYGYFSQEDFDFRGRVYTSHNRLLSRYPGTDGIKTGYVGMSGFNLVTSVKRGNYRLVGVVLGGRTAAMRDQQMMTMLDNVFSSLARERHGGPAKHG